MMNLFSPKKHNQNLITLFSIQKQPPITIKSQNQIIFLFYFELQLNFSHVVKGQNHIYQTSFS
jgi:hypothetical protein